MRVLRSPIGGYSAIMALAPVIFGAGMLLFYSDRVLGDPMKVEGGGALGLAANLSMAGLTAVLSFIVNYGPHLLVLFGLALPVLGALFVIERIDRAKRHMPQRSRKVLWTLACSETALLLAVFVFIFDSYPI